MSGLRPQPPDKVAAALEHLVQRFARMLAAVGYRSGLDDDERDALVQSVRIRLWQAAGDSGETLLSLSTSYVYQAARSAALDLLRTRRRSGAWRAEQLENVSHLTTSDDPSGQLDLDESVERIMAVLDTLAPDRRTVVKLHLAGYARREIAERLNWSEARIRNLLFRGMDDLRVALRRHGLGPPEGA